MIAHDTKRHLPVLPCAALGDVAPFVEQCRAGLPATLHQPLEEFVRLTLPPPLPAGLAWACLHFLALKPEGYEPLAHLAHELFAVLVPAADTPAPLARALAVATHYPVFHGLAKLARARPALATKARPPTLAGLYLALCAGAHDAKLIRPSVYYFDVLTVRDVLLESCQRLGLGWRDSQDIATLRAALLDNNRDQLDQCRNQDMASSLDELPGNAAAKLARLNLLLRGAREFGSPVWLNAPRGHGKRGPRAAPAEEARDIARTEVEYAIATVNDNTAPMALAHGSSCEIIETVSAPSAEPNAPHGADGVRQGLEFHRAARPGGSRLAPRDDRHALRGWYNGWQAQGVPSFTDASRLPLPLVWRLLEALFATDRLAFALAFLCVTTGLDPERLGGLEVIRRRRPRRTRGVRLESSASLLTYELLGGPSDRGARDHDGPSDSHIVRTPVPYELAAILRESGQARPFAGATARLNARAQAFAAHHAGPAPTASRLARSFWLHLPPLGLSNVEAAFLAGEVPSRLNAHADYHRLSRHALHVRTLGAMRQFAQAIASHPELHADLRAWAGTLTFPEPTASSKAAGESDYVGSQVAAPLAPLAEFFEAVRAAVMPYRDRVAAIRPEQRAPLLAEVLNLVNVQLYVLQEFALGVRPRGGIAVVSYSHLPYGAWVEDKGSAKYREFSLSALPQVVAAQQRHGAQAREALREFCTCQRLRIVDERRLHTEQMAEAFEYRVGSDDAGTMRIATMTARRYEQCLRELGLARFCPVRRNQLRHATVSHFQDLPAAALTQYVGHHLPGLDLFAPWSSSSVRSYFELMREVENFLKALNPNPLEIKELI